MHNSVAFIVPASFTEVTFVMRDFDLTVLIKSTIVFFFIDFTNDEGLISNLNW